MAKVTLYPTTHRDVFTDHSDYEPLWSRSQDFGGEVRYWHQSGYGSLPEPDVQIVAGVAVPAMAESNLRCMQCPDTGEQCRNRCPIGRCAKKAARIDGVKRLPGEDHE
jgi:hypothetical protein